MTPAEFRLAHGDPRTDVRRDMFGDVRGWSPEEFEEYRHVVEYALTHPAVRQPATTDTTTGETTR